MTYAIIGFGNIGAALARIFVRNNINVLIANSRGPESLASLAKELSPSVTPTGGEIPWVRLQICSTTNHIESAGPVSLLLETTRLGMLPWSSERKGWVSSIKPSGSLLLSRFVLFVDALRRSHLSHL